MVNYSGLSSYELSYGKVFRCDRRLTIERRTDRVQLDSKMQVYKNALKGMKQKIKKEKQPATV